MTYASDKLYRDVISKKMAYFASVVKVREIMPHLTCLTLSDKEEIEAKREVTGNYNAMAMLLDYIRRRENWPEEFIQALRACEHWALADEISTAYDQIRGIRSQAAASAAAVPVAVAPTPPVHTFIPMPASSPAPSTTSAAPAPVSVRASATVTTATIHSVPHSDSTLLTPEETSAPAVPIESMPKIAPPNQAKAHAAVSAPETLAPLPPEPAHSPEPLLRLPVSDPQERHPSPVLSDGDIHSVVQSDVSVSRGAIPTSSTLSGPPSDPAPCLPKLLTAPNTPSTTLQPSAKPEKSKEPVTATDSSTSLKHPIQDSRPPEKVTVSAQISKDSTIVNQLVDSVHTTIPQNRQPQAASLGTAQIPSSASDDTIGEQFAEDCLSKPGILLSETPPSITSDDLEISYATTGTEVSQLQPALVSRFPQDEVLLQEPYSTTSADLVIHSATTETIDPSPVQHTENLPVENSFFEVVSAMPTGSAPVSNTGVPEHPISNSAHKESTHSVNGSPVASLSNLPVEDHYESFGKSLPSQPGTLVNTVIFSENPSIQNLDGCSPRMPGNVSDTNDKLGRPNHNTHIESAIPPVIFENQSIDLDAPTLTHSPQSEQRKETKKGLLAQLQCDPSFIAAAAVIGVTAVFFAWKLKNKY